ncbi:MAG: heavy metal-associated domain-containing protein [Patescibacteria group bacterium]
METTLKIQGMNCVSCKALIEETVTALPGVQACEVDINLKQAKVTHTPDVDLKAIKSAIESLEELTVELPSQ